MGLDNGIVVGIKKKENETIEIPEYIVDWVKDESMDKDNPRFSHYEICYWRKCWNIRNKIVNICSEDIETNPIVELSLEELIQIREEFINYLTHPDFWTTGIGGSIWTFDAILPRLARDIAALSWVIKRMTEDPTEIVCYFYDSY